MARAPDQDGAGLVWSVCVSLALWAVIIVAVLATLAVLA
jgi:hypothetical protein